MIKKKKIRLLFLFFFSVQTAAQAQNISNLTIEECYTLARENFPLIKKYDLVRKSSGFSLQNASKLYLPQVAVSGQASYQSQTINFSEVIPSIPGVNFPTLSKDQYKIQADISQIIYDAGDINNQKASIRANQAVQEQNIEMNLREVNDRVNQIYFAIILMDEQLKQNEIRKSELQSQLDKTLAALANGTSFRSNADQLKAELINVDMNSIEFKANKQAYLKMLSIIIDKKVDSETKLQMPGEKIMSAEINRPEIKFYDLQKRLFDVEDKKLQSAFTPKVSAFFQGAYGRPTLNIIKNEFGPWFVIGLRLNWNLGSLYSLKNNRQSLHISRQSLEVDKEIFLYNTNLSLSQQSGDIQKYKDLIEQDKMVIGLRESVKKSSLAQLENGVITVHEYISQLNSENTSRQTLILHTIQLLQAEYKYNHISGSEN
ncbi:TolC family protein [Dyadobacter subterraneus]|uniref:TolC family protein n=1 Tax=Dyadobacter subterraneus TaxID=2773304 RepID=A0ABR9WDI8_9BACT|nr:TolC family protein [Dyadobacter subterraneus]MBE9463557.1 TolC family protein [Dyadobacter subterraneus]